MKSILHKILGFAAGLLSGIFVRLGFEIIEARPTAFGGEWLVIPMMVLLIWLGYVLGKELNMDRAYEAGYREGCRLRVEKGQEAALSSRAANR